MSKLARKPITLPDGVAVGKENNRLVFKGAKGELTLDVLPEVTVQTDGHSVTVHGKNSRLASLFASLIRGAVLGVSEGFRKELELVGIGYKAEKEGTNLKLSLGFSHPVLYPIRNDVNVTVEKGTRIIVEGVSKQVVGQVAAEIRRLRPPEPYRGKGIRYADEVVRRKAGKAAKAGSAAKT